MNYGRLRSPLWSPRLRCCLRFVGTANLHDEPVAAYRECTARPTPRSSWCTSLEDLLARLARRRDVRQGYRGGPAA